MLRYQGKSRASCQKYSRFGPGDSSLELNNNSKCTETSIVPRLHRGQGANMGQIRKTFSLKSESLQYPLRFSQYCVPPALNLIKKLPRLYESINKQILYKPFLCTEHRALTKKRFAPNWLLCRAATSFPRFPRPAWR